ncbi:MAG: prefoldin subunit beta [Candidatus Pacearchaeota archaeon]|jgi:prefoldin beta subunit
MVEKDQNQKIQEMQMLEQNLQNILMQKQAFSMELNEAAAALKEINSANDEVFKIVGQLMIKTDKNKIIEELTSKEKILSLRLKSIEKQEETMTKKLSELRDEFMKGMKK